jgi:peptidoglycan-associated lipoprotein
MPERAVSIEVDESISIPCNLPNGREEGPRFDYDEAELGGRVIEILDAVATCLREGALRGVGITVTGHADPRGSDAYNQRVGLRRAESARDYLVTQGLSDDSITVESRGESQAIGTNESGWRFDRRVEIRRTLDEVERDRP